MLEAGLSNPEALSVADELVTRYPALLPLKARVSSAEIALCVALSELRASSLRVPTSSTGAALSVLRS